MFMCVFFKHFLSISILLNFVVRGYNVSLFFVVLDVLQNLSKTNPIPMVSNARLKYVQQMLKRTNDNVMLS